MGDKEFDKSAYVLYHSAQTGFPCLSFDVVPDDDGCGEERLDRDKLSLILITGTQAPRANQNAIHALRFSELRKFRNKRRGGGGDSDEDEEDDEDESDSDEDNENPDLQPILRAIDIPHPWGEINRIRYTQFGSSGLVASWCSSGCVRIYDITRSLFELKDMTISRKEYAIQPIFAFSGHPTEGFGIAWSTVSPGYLATGDCYKNIHIWKPQQSGTWHVDQTPLIGHESSVEDIQWSPTEDKILASCSVDKSIKIWDIRKPALSSCILNIKEAHDCDVNVISWNQKDPAFLLSGGDDGILKVWDFRKFSNSSQRASPIATFKYHCTPVTSLEWDPNDASVFISSGEDQVNIWDLSVEEDEESDHLNRNGVKQESEKMDCGENDDEDESSEDDDDDEEDEDEEEDEERRQMREEEEEMSRKYGDVPPQLLFIHEGQKEVKEIHFHPQIPGLIISTSADSFDIFKTISN